MTTSRPLRATLIAGLLGCNLLVIALSGYSLHLSRGQYVLRAETLTQNITSALDQNLSSSIEKIDLALRTVGDELEEQLAGKGFNEQEMADFLARHEQRLPEVEAFRVANAEGRVILGKGLNKQVPVSWADRDYFRYHRDQADDTLQISKPRMGRVAKQFIVGFSRRYNYPDGSFAGVISAPISVGHFAMILAGYDLGPNGTIILRDKNLDLIARFPEISDQPVGQIGSASPSARLRQLTESGVLTETYYTPASSDGFQRTVTFRRLSKAPMIVIAGAASEDYLADWTTEVAKTSGMAVGFMLFSLLLGRFLLRLLTEAEQREKALADREAQLRTLVEVVPDSIQFKDGEGRWLIANNVCLRLFGLEGIGWHGMTDIQIGAAYPHLAARLAVCKNGDDAAWAAAKPYRAEESVTDVEGATLHFDVIKVPLFDDENNRRAMVVVGRDITARKQYEAELEKHQRQLEDLVQQRTSALLETEAKASHIVQSSADGLYGVDTDGFITFINPAACEMLGYQADQVIGRADHALFHHSRPDGTPYPLVECPSYNAMRLGQRVRVDNEVYWHADGHALPVMYAIHPMLHDGVTTGAVISFVDISEQSAMAEARERALKAAENLARVRSEFLANMSHEIRTPLNGVLGFADIGYRNYQNAEKARDSFAKIRQSGIRLLGVINDILDFSKIEAGKLNIEQTEVSIAEVINGTVEIVRDRADAKQLRLQIEIGVDVPQRCISDPLRIGQVLLNVLSNAVKFTEQGGIRLAVSLRRERLVFTVSDSGIGMNEAQLADLFNPFQQADASATRRFGGTGLGLAISKRILELMHGEVNVQSQPDAGTTVEFSLPYVPSASQENGSLVASKTPTKAVEKPLAGISFLVAEDEVINQAILEENLIEDGARVVMVSNGREAVERVLRDGRDAYDIVLMDIQMPEMDGYEATRRILELAPDLPIIAQTAHAFIEEREKCLAAGMFGHVAKPIDSDALLDLVRQLLPERFIK
ncbi:MAG: ATP-binding protein [Azonexus sp.]|nr:ATP-binding protein [Azonexus sp.]